MDTMEFINNIKSIIQKCENYLDDSFQLRKNKNYNTIWFCKSAVLKFKEIEYGARIEIAKKYLENFKIEEDGVRFTKSEPEWAKIVLNDQFIEKILANIENVFKQCYLDEPVEGFGCCSRYTECSDEKKCIHPDPKISKGCYYKTNLDSGLIFYGKNRNIS